MIGNTADDIWLHGLEGLSDLDTVMYTSAAGSTLAAVGAATTRPTAFGGTARLRCAAAVVHAGDRDVATHLVRTQLLNAGFDSTR